MEREPLGVAGAIGSMRTLLACVAFATTTGLAQQPEPKKPDEPKKFEPIEVKAGEQDERKQSTAAKIVVNRDEILKYGDTTILDSMKRLPGVTVVPGARGGAGEIRMRGLGSGYTQILVNGERMPPGFAIDSLPPDLIERIEIYRSANAEFSTQSIAGTINIVLRTAATQRQREVKLTVNAEHRIPTFNGVATVSDKVGAFSYTLPLNINQFRFENVNLSEQVGADPAGGEYLRYVSQQENHGHFVGGNIGPRLNWDFSKTHTLAIEAFTNWNRFWGQFDERINTALGTPPQFSTSQLDFGAVFYHGRASLRYIHKWDDGRRLEARAGGFYTRRHTFAILDAYNAAGTYLLHRSVEGGFTDSGATSGGKYSLPLAKDHQIALGWDASLGRREEFRFQDDTTFAGLQAFNINETYDARVLRLAAFAQDEWEVADRVSLYLGLRWEGIDTRTVGNVIQEARNRSGVASPIVQVLWKLPGTEKDQLRAGLARTYKAPNTFDLVPRRFVANNNTATTPDFQGNPDLKPELAWSVDTAYEHYFTGGGVFSVSAFARRIENVMLRELLCVNGTYITRPANLGNARVRGIEMDLKTNLRTLVTAAPSMDVRANLTFANSAVDAIPRPNNRLDQQTKFSANLGFDYKFTAAPLSVGANYTFRGGGPVRVSATQINYTSPKRSLDGYGVWKFSPSTQLRVALSNVLGQDNLNVAQFFDSTGALKLTRTEPTFRRISVTLEVKL